MTRPDDEELIAEWRERFERPVAGWVVHGPGTGVTIEGPTWSYESIVRDVAAGATSALDMGTGGGEVLGELADVLPPDTVATEGWPPNVPVAAAALAPFGIDVVAYDATTDRAMPFPDGRFDLVLNRHEAYDPPEAARVLTPGGVFVTQQVDGRSLDGFAQIFGGPPRFPEVNLEDFRRGLEQAGLTIERAEGSAGPLSCRDVGALVGYLAKVPWAVPDFTVDGHAPALLDLHRAARPIEFPQTWFLLVARR